MKKFLAPLSLLIVFALSCSNLENPVGPTRDDFTKLDSWYPCVVVQNPGRRGEKVVENQLSAVRKLQAAGRMNWIRFGGLTLNGDGKDYLVEAKSLGLKTFGIISTKDLESRPSWESAFDEMMHNYPGIDIWEITGEISNPFINDPVITPEYYMERFKNLYKYVKDKYPSVVLASAPTFGSASTRENPVGPIELERFFELGLLDMDVVITLNIYTYKALQQYAGIFSRYREQLKSKRVWVTETGSPNPSQHVNWVDSFYPKIYHVFNPEMVCWYVMWGGDGGGDNGYGLLNNVSQETYEERDLFRILTEGR